MMNLLRAASDGSRHGLEASPGGLLRRLCCGAVCLLRTGIATGRESVCGGRVSRGVRRSKRIGKGARWQSMKLRGSHERHRSALPMARRCVHCCHCARVRWRTSNSNREACHWRLSIAASAKSGWWCRDADGCGGGSPNSTVSSTSRRAYAFRYRAEPRSSSAVRDASYCVLPP